MYYKNLASYFREKYGQKILKLSIDAGFSCPNRKDGKRGCLFCSDSGAGEFAGDRKKSITEQIEDQKKFLSHKNKSNKYIAYFQAYTNTFDDVKNLSKLYYEALSCEGVIGIAVATRPDALNDDIFELFKKINENYELWIEMGLQTVNEKTREIINIGYPLSSFTKAVERFRTMGVKVLAHIIVGLPGEGNKDFLKSIEYVNDKKLWGVKIHSLYIQKDSDIYDYYIKKPFKILSLEEYSDVVVSMIDRLNKDIIVHRITGDADKTKLFLPKWSMDKLKVIGTINKKLKQYYVDKK